MSGRCLPRCRLLRSESGSPLHETSYYVAWRKARASVLSVAQQKSPLARRPYDLRHAAASLWLNAGVAPTEVARRLGHSVAILLKVYANCLDTDEGVANDRIAAALDGVPDSGRLDRIPNDGERSSSGVCGPDADEDSAGDLDHGKAAGGGLA
jgi:hypothetical protein